MTWANPDYQDEAVYDPASPLEPEPDEEPLTDKEETVDDPNYWIGRLIATLKQVYRETHNERVLEELYAWSQSSLCTELESKQIRMFLEAQQVPA